MGCRITYTSVLRRTTGVTLGGGGGGGGVGGASNTRVHSAVGSAGAVAIERITAAAIRPACEASERKKVQGRRARAAPRRD